MKRLKMFSVLFIVLMLFSAVYAAVQVKWSEKLATLTVTDVDPDDMFMFLIDPNGTPSSGLIGRTEALLDWPGSVNITTVGTVATGTINHEPGGLEADVSGYSGLLAISGGSTSEVDAKSELESQIADVADFAEADGDVFTGVHDFGGATSLEVPNTESGDGTLTALGQLHIRGDEDRISYHAGAGGEIAGEVTNSFLSQIFVMFDPGKIYDSNSIIPLPPILAKRFPNGIIIDYWRVDCHLDPDVEMDLNLGYSINPMDMADPNLIDVLDTTNGQSSEDTDGNINGGSAVLAGSYPMLYFDADPEGTCNNMSFTMIYHSEED